MRRDSDKQGKIGYIETWGAAYDNFRLFDGTLGNADHANRFSISLIYGHALGA